MIEIEKFRIVYICALVSLFLLTACNYDQITPDPDRLDCSQEAFTFENQIRDIVNRNCAYSGCHDGISGNPGNFTTYSGLSSKISNGQFEDRVLLTRDMPPDNASGPTSLTEDELKDLTCWIEQGYPEE